MSVLKMGCSWASSYGAGIECDLVQNLRCELAAAQSKLAKYEQAKMPEEPHGLHIRSGIVSYDYAVVQEYAIALRTFAAAQTVRADSNERDMLRASSTGMALIVSHLGAFESLTPYLQQQYKKLEAIHQKCDKAFNAAIDAARGQGEG